MIIYMYTLHQTMPENLLSIPVILCLERQVIRAINSQGNFHTIQ